MPEDHADYDTNPQANSSVEGVEHIADLIRQFVDDRGWNEALATASANGHPEQARPDDRRADE